MNVDRFMDTNILVYAVVRDENEKRRRSLELIEKEIFALSAQVLQEFYVIVTHKIAVPLSPDQALEWIEQFEMFPCISIDTSLIKIGVEISVRYKISYWDGLILAAAEHSGAMILYSEDLNHGQLYGKVRVINPFISPVDG